MKIYITFGQVHAHSVNNIIFDKDSVAVIEAENEAKGREMAFEYFGDKFFTSYTQEPELRFFPRGLVLVEGGRP